MNSKIVELNEINSGLEIKGIADNAFKQYGKIVEGYPFQQFDDYMDRLVMSEPGVVYYPSISELEDNSIKSKISKYVYGGQPIEIGYCAGDNCRLDGLEYHKGSEVIYAVTNMVLLLGHIWDIKDNRYSSTNIEAFYVQKGSAVEIYATTLHFAPCKVDRNGFKAVIILPKDTNCALDLSGNNERAEDQLLFMNNKWLLAHPDAKGLVVDGAFAGITGENIEVKF